MTNNQNNKSAAIFSGWIIFSIFLAVIFFVFFFDLLYQSMHKPFWGDELYGLEQTIRTANVKDLIVRGAQGQGSPAPLDYVLLKLMDPGKNQLMPWDLKDVVYLRLNAISVTLLSLFVVLMIYFVWIWQTLSNSLSIRIAQLICLCCIPFAFIFSRMIYYYAAETRPYALWNAMYFLCLALSLWRGKRVLIFILALVLLAISATASIYQLAMFLIAFVLVGLIEQKKLWNVLKEAVLIFVLPMIVSYYYCTRFGDWSGVATEPARIAFFDLWMHKSTIIPMMLGAIMLCWINKKNRAFAIAPIAFLLMYLIGPIISYITELRGFFFADRQYGYYDLSNAVFLLTGLCCLPALLNSIKSKKMYYVVIFISVCVALSVTFRSKINKKISKAITHATYVFKNPEVLKTTYTGELQ